MASLYILPNLLLVLTAVLAVLPILLANLVLSIFLVLLVRECSLEALRELERFFTRSVLDSPS